MRKIYTLLCALIASTAIWAQNPDPSAWSVGDNVIADLKMGDVDPSQKWTTVNVVRDNSGNITQEPSYGSYWKGDGKYFLFDYIDESNSMYGDHEKGATCMGYYADGAIVEKNPDIYQVVKIPAGYYTIRVQACYRDVGGQETNDGIKAYQAGKSKKNAWLYTEAYADQESAEAGTNPTRIFKTAVRSVFDNDQATTLCDWSPNGDTWRNDDSFESTVKKWNPKTKKYDTKTITTFYPRSIIGASYHFKEGKYWNEYNILLEEDTWVRVGARRTVYVKEDWFALSEWQIIFNGAISDATINEYAEKEITKELDQLEGWQTQFSEATYDGFETTFNKAISDHMGDEYAIAKDGYEEAGTASEKIDIIDGLNQKNYAYEELYQYLGYLSYVLDKSNRLLQKDPLDADGYTTFQATYNRILGEINDCDPATFDEVDPYDFCMERFNALAEARGDYLDTQAVDAETGAKDFSEVINHPWFVDDEYAPTKKEDGSWSLDEPTWQGISGGEYSTNDGARTDITKTVTLYKNDETVKNEWFQRINYQGKTNGLYMYQENGLVGAADTWHSAVFTSGSMDVCQYIIGLPSGYYSLKALVRSWGDGKGVYNNIFMQNSDNEVVTSPLAPVGEGWVEVSTGIIHVKDKELLIGGQSDYTAHYTGFRLFFYGENPPVEKLLNQEIAEVEEFANDLQFAGDVNAVDALIKQCVKPFTMDNFDEYRGYLNDARNYIRAAKKAYDNNKAADTYTSLMSDYGSIGQAYDFLEKAWDVAFELGNADTDTYEMITPANELADKYSDYMKVYAEAVGYDDADLKNVLQTQEAALLASIQTKEVLDSYMKQLNLPINLNKMKALGAGAATETSPVDVTAMIINPTFELEESNGVIEENDVWERGHGYGWTKTGEGNAQSNEYSRGNYEVWNSGASGFTFSQTLTGMPAGTYELSCLAVYREKNAVDADAVAAFEAVIEAAGNEEDCEEDWPSHYAQLFAKGAGDNDNFTYIKAVERLKGTDFSFTDVPTAYEINEDINEPYATAVTVLGLEEDVNKYDYSELKWTHIAQNAAGEWTKATKNDETGEWTYSEESGDKGTYPFDTEIEIGGVKYYFPASMYGFWVWSQKAPEKMFNKVRFTIESGENIQLGIRKTGGASGDWVIFDDFKLEYLSGDVLNAIDITGIEDVDAEKGVKNNVLYNVAGQVVDSSYKGIVIDSEGNKYLQK